MKKIISLFVCLVLCAYSLTARAEVMDFPRFTIDVPEGWKAEFSEGVLGLIHKNGKVSCSVAMGDVKQYTLQALADHFAALLKGTTPEMNDGGYYSFTFKNDQGLDSRAFIGANPHTFALVTVTGEHPEIEPMLRSIHEK